MKQRLRTRLEYQSHGEWPPVPVIVFKFWYTADMLNALQALSHGWLRQNYDLYDRALSELDVLRS